MNATMSLMEILEQRLASGKVQLPVFPPLALQLQAMLAGDDADIDKIAQKIARDQALASQLLRVSNSAFYSGLSKITTIRDSIVRIGTQQVINLVHLATQEQQYRSKDKFIGLHLTNLWQHAAATAQGSLWLAERLGFQSMAHEAFLAGLLHDIGKLFLLKVMETIQASGNHNLELSTPVVDEVLDTMHAAQGALLLQKWNLPEVYCAVVRLHHQEDYDGSNPVLGIVRLANLACHKLGIGLHQEPSIVVGATPEARLLGLSELRAAELEIMLEDWIALNSQLN